MSCPSSWWDAPQDRLRRQAARVRPRRVNVLDNATRLAGPNSTSVADPNDDTLYSTAFLDLRAGPQLLSVPSMRGRYVDFQLLDMYTNTIADVGVLTDGGHGGTYAFVGPGWHGTIPKGVVRIDVPTPDAWLLGRTQVKGAADLLAAVELVRRSQPKPSTSAPAAPGQGRPLLRWLEPAATRSGSQPRTFRLMDLTASGRSRSINPQGSSWPTRSTATQSETKHLASCEVPTAHSPSSCRPAVPVRRT